MGRVGKNYCRICGEELKEDNARYDNSIDGVACECLECEQKSFRRFAEKNGAHLGLFYNCLKYNIPLEPLLLTEENYYSKNNKWKVYIDLLIKNDKYSSNIGEVRTFEDGVSNIFAIFGKEMTARDFSQYCEYEKQQIKTMPGTEEQRNKWGIYPGATTDEYNELDRQFANRILTYKGMTVTPQMEDTLVKVCKWNVLIEKLVNKSKINEAKALQQMVETALASESMRKKDEKPVEALAIDSVIAALEKAGCAENGKLKKYDELVDALRDKQIKSKKYEYSLDVADQMIFYNYNNVRLNNDEPLVSELPSDLKMADEYGEFESTETDAEKKAKRYIGVTPISYVEPKATTTKKTNKKGKKK